MGCFRLRMGQIFNYNSPETEPNSLILTKVRELAEDRRDGQFQRAESDAASWELHHLCSAPPDSHSCNLQISPVSRAADLIIF